MICEGIMRGTQPDGRALPLSPRYESKARERSRALTIF